MQVGCKEVFNATNDTITTKILTKEFLAEICPNTPTTREMDEWEAPLSNRKIRDVLGFKEEHTWRMYYKPWTGYGTSKEQK